MSGFNRGLVTLAAMLAAGCASPTQPSRVVETQDPSGPNTLTSAERAAGWVLLFDGRSTSGWRGFRQATIPDGWKVIDGALTREAAGGDVITAEPFGNFELALEWRIAEGGNSGIMYRVSEGAAATFLSGPEMQVLDNARHPDGQSPLTSAGACYAVYAPSRDVTRAAGEWNQARVVASGSHIEHWLNGVKVVEYELGSDDWLRRVEASPYRDAPEYGRAVTGHIALQDHGDRVAFRSIKIKRLP
jgi:3-keto-disaccharide hydrolase